MSPAPVAALKVKAAPIDREIVISAAPGGRFRVAVIPRLDGEPKPEVFSAMTEARGYAGGLRLVRGWPVRIAIDGASRG